MWVILGIFSSLFLGFHEIFKKAALNHNAVLPVLLFGSVSGAVVFLPFLVLSKCCPGFMQIHHLFIAAQNTNAHLLFLSKSIIVAAAWLFGYFSVKHLPVTVLSPINASGPVWTTIGAILIYEETMNFIQWTGVAICMGFYFLLSTGGNINGSNFSGNRWILFALLSIFFNSVSALLDKFLVLHYDRIAMQAWFSIYTTLIFTCIVILIWYPSQQSTTHFIWRPSILLIGIFLVVADFFYFKALTFENSLVSVLIIIRRASAVLVFAAGALYFKETSLRKRGIILAGILGGVALVVFGSL